MEFSDEVRALLRDPSKKITILTGAGISAESGIPTFRGPEGYWTIGSRVYMPEEVATQKMFQESPREVWEWYLYRLGVCLDASPNPGHLALVSMENQLAGRFVLITQNVDNLHIRAGNSLQRTFQIHGNISFTRCSKACVPGLYPLASGLARSRQERSLETEELELLLCEHCGDWLRPHVLWFDEYYDEEYFRFDSSIKIARQTDLLIIVGTSGATSLPAHVASLAHENQACILDINIEQTPFSDIANNSPGGGFIQCSAAEVLPRLAEICTA